MSKTYRVFAINPGSTSTKIALFVNDTAIFNVSVYHDAGKLKEFKEISDQFEYRKENILNELKARHVDLKNIDAFVGRGGGLVALEGGTYPVNDTLLHHARIGFTVKHPAILGSQLAHDFAQIYGGQAFVVNPPDVDEFDEVARLTGWKGVYRQSKIHALNQKEIGIRHAASLGKSYSDLNLIIAHIGGGLSVTAHRAGRMVDANDIVNGDGPMAPTRAGALPAMDVIKACFSGEYSEQELADKLTKNGGLVDHLGTAEVRDILGRIREGDRYAKLVYDTMIYQIIKYIGSMAAALKGKVDGILLTGGIANEKYLVQQITEAVTAFGPVSVYAGEFEMEALASGAIRVLEGSELPKNYSGNPVWTGPSGT